MPHEEPRAAAAPLPILSVPHPALRARAREVGPCDANLPGLVAAMFATVRAADGIGLAAPQVGIGLRVAVLRLARGGGAPFAMLNPTVDWASPDEAVRAEGCLSLPGAGSAEVSRPARVAVSYTDLSGARVSLEAEGLLAACLQHEIDHLDGVLITDRVSRLKRDMLMRRMRKSGGR